MCAEVNITTADQLQVIAANIVGAGHPELHLLLSTPGGAVQYGITIYQTTPLVSLAGVFGKPKEFKGFHVLVSSRPVVGSALARNMEMFRKSPLEIRSHWILYMGLDGRNGSDQYTLALFESEYIFKFIDMLRWNAVTVRVSPS